MKTETGTKATLRLTVSRPVYLGVRHSFGAHDQSFLYTYFCLTVAGFLLSDERTGLQFTLGLATHLLSGTSLSKLVIIFYCLI
jgi:hypothetical protein